LVAGPRRGAGRRQTARTDDGVSPAGDRVVSTVDDTFTSRARSTPIGAEPSATHLNRMTLTGIRNNSQPTRPVPTQPNNHSHTAQDPNWVNDVSDLPRVRSGSRSHQASGEAEPASTGVGHAPIRSDPIAEENFPYVFKAGLTARDRRACPACALPLRSRRTPARRRAEAVGHRPEVTVRRQPPFSPESGIR
jgi:hypothetical protein